MLADTNRLPSADLTNNPAADGNSADDIPQTTEDTNAVVSPSHTDFLLTRVGAAFVALRPAVAYVGLSGLGTVVAFNTYQEEEVSALSRMLDVCMPVGGALCEVAAAIGLRRVTGTGKGRGQLAALGAGGVRISERARRGLGRAHV
eukprot:SAG22_NODE_118_length_19263_cov_16.155813_19_plen_146_part_00